MIIKAKDFAEKSKYQRYEIILKKGKSEQFIVGLPNQEKLKRVYGNLYVYSFMDFDATKTTSLVLTEEKVNCVNAIN